MAEHSDVARAVGSSNLLAHPRIIKKIKNNPAVAGRVFANEIMQ